MKNFIKEHIIEIITALVIVSWFNFSIIGSEGISEENIKNGCNEVRALYLALLQREPDPSGLKSHCELYEGGASIKELAEGIMSSQEFNGKQ